MRVKRWFKIEMQMANSSTSSSSSSPISPAPSIPSAPYSPTSVNISETLRRKASHIFSVGRHRGRWGWRSARRCGRMWERTAGSTMESAFFSSTPPKDSDSASTRGRQSSSKVNSHEFILTPRFPHMSQPGLPICHAPHLSFEACVDGLVPAGTAAAAARLSVVRGALHAMSEHTRRPHVEPVWRPLLKALQDSIVAWTLSLSTARVSRADEMRNGRRGEVLPPP